MPIAITADACTGIAGKGSVSSQLLVYPNPSHGIVNLVFNDAPENTGIRVINMLGEVVMDLKEAGSQNSMDLRDRANGVYFVMVLQAGKPVSTLKIVKE